ncbi:nuclear mitotic apparatus protein 1 isoform X2 [Hippocampus comes]|uniref:nuclear mitotic apparatus protein 1 isoform X2 n=1 Tax=Hippocampus comes TaxID=109280 RepID=UPI00094EA33B|nr:PREDICTED: nuclear mitotic apparatus protein 1-like isoform X2 [Hippocampus comes]
MSILNLGVKALLSWVNNTVLAHREINIEELRDGEFLLRVVYILKKEPNPPLIQSTEERFKVIAEFVENDCRFSPTKGPSVSWDNIRNGINLTVEIAKVLLLLVYHDMMSERCTLKTLDCEVEREIANLTISFVMESHGSVFLSSGLDAYLAKRYLPVPPEILAQTASTSTSSVSTASIPSDEDSPVLHRTKKITFVDMHTVASSSVSNSPLQDIMNTPKFQLRKIQRQMIKEQDYRDGLEKELADKISLITQRESHINQLQYRLDKMKQEQSDQELTAKEQINELETKNNSLQLRLHEILKDNKDCKSNFLLMERKVNELEEENGVLSSQMRRANAQLSIFQAEVGRLTETLASGQEEWKAKMDYLQSELGQATAQKEHLAEQIQILQGKISCLQDEITLATKQDVGENMGSVMEKNMRSAASTFGVGAENEPEGAPDDWMRIAELQARNKACLPHLKSSYPAEFEAGCKSVLPFTDEDVRTGDPTETIRRASVMLGQLQDSLASHCHSLAAVHASTAAGIRSHRLSLMADHPTSKSVSSSQLKSQRFTKRAASTLCVPQTSPEVKKIEGQLLPPPSHSQKQEYQQWTLQLTT